MADPAVAESAMTIEEIPSMKVTDLRKKLKELNLPITGNKSELIERLQEAYVSCKGSDSFDNTQLSFEGSQISELESADDSGAVEDSVLLDQDQYSSYINSSLEDDSKVLDSKNNNINSVSVIMPPKKRTFIKVGAISTAEKKVSLNRTSVTDVEFEIKENQPKSKPATISTNGRNNSDEKINLSVKNMSAAERLAMRAKRFNVSSSDTKPSNLRSLSNNRNSKQSILTSATAPDLNVLKKRAERFGQCVSTVMKQIEQKERLLKRKCKFGANLAVSSTTNVDEQVKKKQRAERFGIS